VRPDKCVLDTNGWITYFINREEDELTHYVEMKKLALLRSDQSTEELIRVLGYKKLQKYLPYNTDYYTKIYFALTLHHQTVPRFTLCADPNDNFIFDLAIQGKAKYIVSGDAKVRNTPVPTSIQVLSLTAFKKMMR
jgi:putative PIN family toxin of toxin-antitoxin system